MHICIIISAVRLQETSLYVCRSPSDTAGPEEHAGAAFGVSSAPYLDTKVFCTDESGFGSACSINGAALRTLWGNVPRFVRVYIAQMAGYSGYLHSIEWRKQCNLAVVLFEFGAASLFEQVNRAVLTGLWSATPSPFQCAYSTGAGWLSSMLIMA